MWDVRESMGERGVARIVQRIKERRGEREDGEKRNGGCE